MAKVIPIYKAGEKHIFSNYRPVSVLSQFSKIPEKKFSTRLKNFINKHNMCDQQYGFRANRKTSHALIQLVEEITTAIEHQKYAVGDILGSHEGI